MISSFDNWKMLNEAPITKPEVCIKPQNEVKIVTSKHDQKAFFMPSLLTLETRPAVFMGFYDPIEASKKWMEGERMAPYEYREFMNGNFKPTRCYFELPKSEPTLAEETHSTNAEEMNCGSVHMESNSGSTQEMVTKLAHERIYTRKDLKWFDANAEELRQVRFCEKRPGMIAEHAKKLIERFSGLSYPEKVIRNRTLSTFERRLMVNQGFSINLSMGEDLLAGREKCKSLEALQIFMASLNKYEVMHLKLAMKRNPSRAVLPYSAPVATKTMVSGSGTAFTLKVKA